jgi:hypothetical protein
MTEPRIGKDRVLIFQREPTENGSHALGVFKMNASFSPASSHLLDTSVKDFPTATMRVSSSERAIQLSKGADLSTFNLMIASGDIRLPQLLDARIIAERYDCRLLRLVVTSTGRGLGRLAATGVTSVLICVSRVVSL